jgi:hypothetical protein
MIFKEHNQFDIIFSQVHNRLVLENKIIFLYLLLMFLRRKDALIILSSDG